MKKIPSVFVRDFHHSGAITPEVTPGCEWVLAGEGVATRKRDGTACLFRDGKLYRRYDAKRGKTPPPGFEPAQDPDPRTGHWPGWLEVNFRNPAPEDVWHALAYYQTLVREDAGYADGFAKTDERGSWTYELCGPRLQTNHEGLSTYEFFAHGTEKVSLPPGARSFESLRSFLETFPGEGLVFWRDLSNPDCDKAKITREMFGFNWPLSESDLKKNPGWTRPADWPYEEDWGSPAWNLRMERAYEQGLEKRERLGFTTCPQCRVEHTAKTLQCRSCGFAASQVST